MKIMLVIDDLGSGGAQRQISNLAIALRARGVDVTLFVYNEPEHEIFRPAVEAAGVAVLRVSKPSRFSTQVPRELMRVMQRENFDAVISFLDTPNIYCELAQLGARRQTLIVSERLSHLAESGKLIGLLRRMLHGLASQVVCNSQSQTDFVQRFPWLKSKTRTIYNGYPAPETALMPTSADATVQFLAIGRVTPQKNPLLLAQALAHFHKVTGTPFRMTWIGRVETLPGSSEYYRRTCEVIEGDDYLKRAWNWAGEQKDVLPFIHNCHAVLHPSSYEGLPNVVCEGMLAGRPVIVSNVCDNADLVKDGERGIVIPELTAEAISDSIAQFVAEGQASWATMGQNARTYALENLSIERMCDAYLAMVEELAGAR